LATPITTTIRGRLVLLTLGLLLPGLLIGAYLLWDSYENSRAAFDRQLLETARALSLVVDRELGQAAALNRALSTSPHLANGDLRAFDRQAREVEDSDDTWIVLSDDSGQQLINTRLPFGQKLPKDADIDELWRELRNGATIVSNLIPGAVAEQPVISVDSPVEVGGRVRYALSFVMLPSVFNKVTIDQNLPEGWNGTILDSDLSIVARSSGGAGVVGRKPSPPVAAGIAKASSGVVESQNLENVPTIVAFSTSPLYRWTFAVSVPRAQVTNAITYGLAIAALGGLTLLVLGALGAARVARSITRPVEGLAKAAQALGRGDPVVPPLTSIREVNAVSESLQEAAGDLAARSLDLRGSESRLRLAVQATGLGIWDVDVATKRRTWSHEFRKILGLADDASADPGVFTSRIHPEDRDWVNKRYNDFFKGLTGGQYEAEFRIRHALTGEERWVVTSGRLILDEAGKAVRGSGTMMDVTERRRVEESLRESEERFRSMADSAPALIWMTDADGDIVFLNRYHEQFFGHPVEKLFGGDWRTVIHPDDLDSFLEEFQRAVQSRLMWRREVRVRDGAGSTRWLRCEGAPRKSGAEGDFLGYVGCNVDITESKLAADALEKRIDERTGELAAANRQLVAQIEERERVEETLRQVQRLEAVGQLTSGVAHDFNNLLTVILGNLSFAERSAKDAPLKKRMSNMRMAAERGASLVAQLLAFSRRQRLEPKAVNLNETVGGMRELLQSSMGGTVAVDIILEEDLWPALVDPTQIELIILNLAINARDAMDVGGLLKVETSNVTLHDQPERPEQPASGDYVVVSVTDSGSGMSDEIMARVFEPFFTTKEVGKGSGLGLSQVLGFAKQSGGGVRIETREGKGTTVCVYLPRAAQDLPKAKKKAPRARQPVPAVPTILLVDDDDLVREVTASKLEEFGYKILQAANGPSALLELEKAASLDLLILDFAMPGMNGAEVARAARKRRPDVPLMFLTGYADLTALGEFAAEPILHKPFRDAELGKLVADMLKGTKNSEKSGAA
jgi:PAS domain S-box-containing protein